MIYCICSFLIHEQYFNFKLKLYILQGYHMLNVIIMQFQQSGSENIPEL